MTLVHNVPVLTGGVGFDNGFNFSENQFVGKIVSWQIAKLKSMTNLNYKIKESALSSS
ncbi:MAG TPA: hypothetical protein VH500_09045 [Nitrososphaeraceae archaeon]|jgi:hypothetical protein